MVADKKILKLFSKMITNGQANSLIYLSFLEVLHESKLV